MAGREEEQVWEAEHLQDPWFRGGGLDLSLQSRRATSQVGVDLAQKTSEADRKIEGGREADHVTGAETIKSEEKTCDEE